MEKANRATVAGLLLSVATAVGAVNVLVSAQTQIDTANITYSTFGRDPSAPDISGEWLQYNDERDTSSQAPLGDYTGIAFNEAGLRRSDTTPESIWSTSEYQCRPHSAPHQWRGLGGARIYKEQDPLTRAVKAYHVQFVRSLDRPIYMDGRPHPPAYAPHSWSGFSTAEWVGNTLKVTTTHLKDGFLRRGSPQTTDMYALTEYITRHDEILTINTVVDDPLYLDHPYTHSTTYVYDTHNTLTMETCNASSSLENGGTDRHHVPHFLPGSNVDYLTEWLKMDNWVPAAAARGGVKVMYPEYRGTLNGSVNLNTLTVPVSPSVVQPAKLIADQAPRDGAVHVLPVQGNIYMLVADGVNITASVGAEGIALVNTGSKQMTDKVLAAVNQLSASVVARTMTNTCMGVSCPGTWGWSSPYMNSVITSPTPAPRISYIINTSASADHAGGNEKLATAGFVVQKGGFDGAIERVEGATVLAHENALNRLNVAGPDGKLPPTAALPTASYFDDFYKLPTYFNGEGVVVFAAPAANTDGDSLVYFHRSEVISAGDVFSTVSYPIIDVAKGGSIQGELRALNNILDMAVAEYRSQGGTWIVPGRGRLSDTADVATYRNMLSIIRDRIQDSIKKGMTLAQVKAAKPTLDFDGRYGSTTGPWTTDMFIEAVYRSLQEKK